MSYITEVDLENHILQDIDSSYSSWISSIIGFVEAYIDQYCGTNFQDTGSVTRYFDSYGGNELIVGDLQSISSLQILNLEGDVEQTLTEGTDFWLYPLNDTVKNKVVLSGVNLISEFPNRQRSVKITGSFGFDTVPGPIKLAAIQLCAKLINEGLRGGQVRGETLGSYRVDYREVNEVTESMGIKEILNQYREVRLL